MGGARGVVFAEKDCRRIGFSPTWFSPKRRGAIACLSLLFLTLEATPSISLFSLINSPRANNTLQQGSLRRVSGRKLKTWESQDLAVTGLVAGPKDHVGLPVAALTATDLPLMSHQPGLQEAPACLSEKL